MAVIKSTPNFFHTIGTQSLMLLTKSIKVVFFQRKPLPIHKSIEGIFNDIRQRMPAYVKCVTVIFKFPSNGLFKRLYTIWQAYRNQGDVNHITGDIHFSALLLEKQKTMMTVHDCRMLSDTAGLKHFIFKTFWFTLPLKRCSLLTVVSRATKDELLKYVNFPVDKIHIIPNSISEGYKFNEKQFNTAKPVILQVGTTINKNIDRLFEALKDIQCHLNIVGHLTHAHHQKLQSFNIGYTNFFELTESDLIQQYYSCDMLSFVSTYEGFGMPIIEANTVGRPVVTSNILSMPEVAADAACIVDPFDVEEIKRGISKIIRDPAYRDQLVRNGLRNCKRFDPRDIANSYLACYKQLSGKFSERL